jgi:hypothetical protein
MPYIKRQKRKELDPLIDDLTNSLSSVGDYNYAITRLLHSYIVYNGLCYSTLNNAMGVVECAKQELYRTVIAPYEDDKCEENGAISEFDKPHAKRYRSN